MNANAMCREKCGMLAHRLLLKYCDYQAQKYQRIYDQYKDSIVLDEALAEAERYREKREVLSSKLSPSDVYAGLNTYYIARLVRSLTGQTKTDGFLSADDILTLVKAQNCTDVELDTEVWYELLTLTKDLVADKYYGKIVETAISNGDITLLAEGMNDLVALVRHVQKTMTSQDIQDIQRGKPVASVILSLLEDEQLRQIDAFLSKEWSYSKYDDLAKKQYGGSYQQFIQRTETLTIDQLIEARKDASDAAALVVGYLAGKSYALAWEVQR